MPALAVVDGIEIGIEPFATFVLKDTRMWVPDATCMAAGEVPADPARSGLTQDQFNAVLLLGPAGSMVTSEPRGLSSRTDPKPIPPRMGFRTTIVPIAGCRFRVTLSRRTHRATSDCGSNKPNSRGEIRCVSW